MHINPGNLLYPAVVTFMAVGLIASEGFRQGQRSHQRSGYGIIPYPNEVKVSYAGRIVNGSPVPITSFPFMVSIQRKQYVWEHYCGGSIYNPTTILTACHCVVLDQKIVGNKWKLADATNMRVVAGASDWAKPTRGRQTVKVSKLMAHPKCSNHLRVNGVYNYDVGLVFLKKPLMFSNAVHPFKLISDDIATALEKLKEMVLNKMQCYSPGWGFTVETTRSVSTQLMMAAVQLMTSQECRERFCLLANNHCQTDFYTIHQMCVVSADQSDCYGDSGGPLVCNGYLYGTVSYGHHCYPGWPTVYQNIQPILEILNIATGKRLTPEPSGYATPAEQSAEDENLVSTGAGAIIISGGNISSIGGYY